MAVRNDASLTDGAGTQSCRKEKRKASKKQKRKQTRQEAAIRRREEEEAFANDPEQQLLLSLREKEEAELSERARRDFEEREKLWLEAAAAKKAQEEEEEEKRKGALRQKLLEGEESPKHEEPEQNSELDEDEWEYVEEGPAEIIWGEKEIIVKKNRVKVPKRHVDRCPKKEEDDRPTSNPLPPQSAAFAAFQSGPTLSAQELLDSAAQQIPNFGTEQDKAHCPFHLKTGACRFGVRCSRVHFYPDKANTLLIKNMYTGPGVAWELDEGLEYICYDCYEFEKQYTDEEVECCYEEFYEDVHTEFLKFGEIVNFKVCRNSSVHLRGNVYVHYKSVESAVNAYQIMNSRYYAGKQIKCEFIGITRWKVAICGEYMKSRLKTCSHGAACNFIHCFRNPGGDYEWADWDNPPPKYWVKKMAALFGHSECNEFEHPKHRESSHRKKAHAIKRSRHGEENRHTDSESESTACRGRHNSQTGKHDHSRRKGQLADDDFKRSERKPNSKIGEYIPGSASRSHNFEKSYSREKESRGYENNNSKDCERSHKRHRTVASSSKTGENHPSYGGRNSGDSYIHSERYNGQGSPDWNGDTECSGHTRSDVHTRHSYKRTSGDYHRDRELLEIENVPRNREFQVYPERYTPLAQEHDTEHKPRKCKSRDRSVSSGGSHGDERTRLPRTSP